MRKGLTKRNIECIHFKAVYLCNTSPDLNETWVVYTWDVEPEMKPFDVLNSLHDVLCNLDKSPLHSSWRFQCGFLSPSWPLYHKLLGRYLMFYVTAGCHQIHSLQSLRYSIYQPCICIKHCFSCSISPLSTSDHLWILVTNKLPTTNKRPHSARRTVWCYSQSDFEKASKMLDSIDWDLLLDEPDMDHCWQTWQSTYLNIISKCISYFPAAATLIPWINHSI